jgi:selenium metabolism protein YedF
MKGYADESTNCLNLKERGDAVKEQTVDARGMLCPKPLMLVKKMLDQADVGTGLIVLLDNEMAFANVTRFLKDNHAEPVCEQDGNQFAIRAEKREPSASQADPADYCAPVPGHSPGGPLVMVFTSNMMGRGSEELGQLLVQACINTLPEMDVRPETLIMYNSGIHLAIEGSKVLESLQKLADSGVRILVCGTCLDYFQVTDKIKVGIVSNMYEILDALCNAGRIIYP